MHCLRSVVLKLHVSDHLEGLVKFAESLSLGWGPRMCVSNEFQVMQTLLWSGGTAPWEWCSGSGLPDLSMTDTWGQIIPCWRRSALQDVEQNPWSSPTRCQSTPTCDTYKCPQTLSSVPGEWVGKRQHCPWLRIAAAGQRHWECLGVLDYGPNYLSKVWGVGWMVSVEVGTGCPSLVLLWASQGQWCSHRFNQLHDSSSSD